MKLIFLCSFLEIKTGQAITELGFSMASTTPFLGSKEHGGFLFIRPTFQCMQNIIIPENPYLIGILIHRWEVPWAKIFPLRLMLRLGALHRYYPSPHLSVRGRNSVYAEIAQTIINILADFRTYSFTIPTIRGMYIHMEDRRTNVLIPRNRYDQVMKALDDSSDHIFALAGNFSQMADGHLVCVQNTESGCAETHAYSTQAINIQGKPRKGNASVCYSRNLLTMNHLICCMEFFSDGCQFPCTEWRFEDHLWFIWQMQHCGGRPNGSNTAQENGSHQTSIENNERY